MQLLLLNEMVFLVTVLNEIGDKAQTYDTIFMYNCFFLWEIRYRDLLMKGSYTTNFSCALYGKILF